MPNENQNNFLISIISSILIFALSYLAGAYAFRFGKAYGLSAFFAALIAGLIILIMAMHKYRK